MPESSRNNTRRTIGTSLVAFVPIALLSLLLAPHSLPMQWVNLLDAEMLNEFESIEFGPVGTEAGAFTLFVQEPMLPSGYRGNTKLVLIEKPGRQFSWPVWLVELALLFLVVYAITAATTGSGPAEAARVKEDSSSS